jgi:alkylation response protein AidB-like acyl-CoA dehydrogenase
VLGGVAFAHLRRPGPPAVVAEPAAGGGWVLSGEAPWATAWGMAGLFAVAARSRDRVVFAALPAGERAGLSASPPLPLAVMHASSTVRLLLDRVAVPAGDVLDDLSFADWSARDRVVTAQPNPAAFGVAARCLRLLEEAGSPAAAPLGEEWDECRRRSYAAAPDPADDDEDVKRLVGLRAWSLELAVRAAYALVVATGGRSMTLAHPAPRLLREASFYAVQAQTPPVRAAVLERLTRRS